MVEKDSGNAFLHILIKVSHLQLAVGFQRADDVGEPGRFEPVLEIFQSKISQGSATTYVNAGTISSVTAKKVEA